jgi:hypothetical protein
MMVFAVMPNGCTPVSQKNSTFCSRGGEKHLANENNKFRRDLVIRN